MNKWVNRIGIGGVILVGAMTVALVMGSFSRSQISEVSGLAVAESQAKWNALKDVSHGDAQTSGLAAFGPYMYDSSNARWDRLKGDTTSGIWVNVKAQTGAITPGDDFTNPTTANLVFALLGGFDGTNWDRLLTSTHADGVTTGAGLNTASIMYGFNGTNYDRIRTDLPSKNIVTIDQEHHQVHVGKFFTVSDNDTDIDTGAPKYWRITTPNTAIRVHCVITVNVIAEALMEFFENPTITGAGTGLTAFNNDRNSATAATATTFFDTTVSNDGTKILSVRVGGNNPSGRVGGTGRTEAEFILKQNEDYIIKITPDADNDKGSIIIEWYEV